MPLGMASPEAIARTSRGLEGRFVTGVVVGALALLSVVLLASASDAESGLRALIRTTMPELRATPRLDRTPGEPGPSPAFTGADTEAVLREADFRADEIAALREDRAIA